jgi:hypothetical protein
MLLSQSWKTGHWKVNQVWFHVRLEDDGKYCWKLAKQPTLCAEVLMRLSQDHSPPGQNFTCEPISPLPCPISHWYYIEASSSFPPFQVQLWWGRLRSSWIIIHFSFWRNLWKIWMRRKMIVLVTCLNFWVTMCCAAQTVELFYLRASVVFLASLICYLQVGERTPLEDRCPGQSRDRKKSLCSQVALQILYFIGPHWLLYSSVAVTWVASGSIC